MRNLIKRHVFDQMIVYTYVIDFQKRNLFHAHILIIAHFDNDVIENNVNDVVQIMISNFEKKFKLYELIIKHMINKNCKNVKNVICHDEHDRHRRIRK